MLYIKNSNIKNITLSEDKTKKIHLKYLNTSYNIICYNIFSEEEFDILKNTVAGWRL